MKTLTVSARETLDVLVTEEFPLSRTSGLLEQSEEPPTIWPWIAVPNTVPITSTIIPESNTGAER